MHCYDTLATIEGGTGACVALGYFDGVHLGHRRVLARTVEAARERGCTSAVFTFAPPLDRAVKGRAILTPEEKARRIAAMGVEHYVRPPFEEFCTLSPEAFVHDVLAVRFGAKAVFCGDNFTFGSRKAGNVDMLRRLCAAAGISVEIVPMVQREGAPVSSSRIRACLEAGDVETAGAYLLERYAGETHEIIYELCLDRKGKLLACKRLNDGGASSAALDIRKVVENAILTSASTVILAHNHPSGIALPSDDDCAATTRAAQALQTIGVALADHIIVADDDFVSMAQSGYLTPWEHL